MGADGILASVCAHANEYKREDEGRKGAGCQKMETHFTTREAYAAQRLLHDLILAPRDPLQLHAQTLLNKYNMHPDNARMLASQKVETTKTCSGGFSRSLDGLSLRGAVALRGS